MKDGAGRERPLAPALPSPGGSAGASGVRARSAATRGASGAAMSRLERAHHALVTRLAALRVPRIVGEADGADIRTLADHMIEIADGVDAYMEAIGRELAANAPCAVAAALFKQPLFAAVDGNA